MLKERDTQVKMENKVEKLGYLHANRLKGGLVDDPKHEPWNGCVFYPQRGKVLIEAGPVELDD